MDSHWDLVMVCSIGGVALCGSGDAFQSGLLGTSRVELRQQEAESEHHTTREHQTAEERLDRSWALLHHLRLPGVPWAALNLDRTCKLLQYQEQFRSASGVVQP